MTCLIKSTKNIDLHQAMYNINYIILNLVNTVIFTQEINYCYLLLQ